MSQKRKFESYHDPDYPQTAKLPKREPEAITSHERFERIRLIARREFQRELLAKEQEVLEIDNRIQLARKLLHRVRYAVVSNYYNRKGTELPSAEVQQSIESLAAPENAPPAKELQTAIHPALKSILGKKTVDYDEILKIRPTREAAKTAKTSIKEKLRTKKEEKRLQRAKNGIIETVICHDAAPKLPRHVEPIKIEKRIPQLNAARGRNQTKHLIAVGNTSKYVGDEKSANGGVTHKWLVYVQTKTPVPIEKIVKKVRFFLHPSYRPNDIVDVSDPPFQLSRRGWGEFPIRLQLFFDSSLQQKPVQLMHNLVLDKSLSGMQTMGAETLVEIWLCTDRILEPESTIACIKEEKAVDEEISEDARIDHIEDNLMEFLNRIENQTSKSLCEEEEKIEPTLSVASHVEASFSCANNAIAVNDNFGLHAHSGLVNGFITVPPVEAKKEERTEVENNISTYDVDLRPNRDIKPQQVFATTSVANQSSIFETEPVKILDTTKESLVGSTSNILTRTIPAVNSVQNKPQTFQRRYIKCIDKQGNVKLVQMLVKPTGSIQNGQAKPLVLNSPAGSKLFIISKPNGQVQTPPLIRKMLPTTSNNSTATSSATAATSTITNLASSSSRVLMPTSLHLKSNSNSASGITQQNITDFSRLKPSTNSTNKNQILFKNGKMYIIDPLQSKLKQQNKKQESLLKPQVSLLKPIVKNDNFKNCMRNDAKSIFNHTAIATDHDYTSLVGQSPTPNTVTIYRPSNPQQHFLHKQKSSIVTVSSPNNSRINVIVTKLDNDDDDDDGGEVRSNSKTTGSQKPTPLMQKPRRDYRNELEELFNKSHPTNVRQAVEFLLKRLPLVNAQAASVDYKLSFPFITSSQETFDRLMTPKQKANEWLRSKYVSQLVEKHPEINSSKLWTTKEIIVFARLHAYTPVIKYKTKREINDDQTDRSLKDLVQKEIKREKYDIQTLTLIHDTYDWINEVKRKIGGELKMNDEIINVDGSDGESANFTNKEVLQSPTKNMGGKYLHPLDDKHELESSLVNDICQQIGVRLKPEEILPGVIHSSAQLVLVQSLKSFVEDLLRRSASSKFETDSSNSACLQSNVIRPDDIKNAILSRPQWDFLTNNGLGVAKPKDPID